MTLRCLKAVAEALAGLPAEVWLVDNGSLDGTPEAVAADFPTVKVIRNDRNLGFAAANNQALRQAHGRYWLLLNTDTLLAAEALQAMVRYLDGHPRTAMVGPQLADERGRLQNSVHSFPGLATELLNRSLLRILFPRRYPSKRTRFAGPTEVDALLGACLLVRAEAAREVGLLDEEYFFYYEETDWCLRMKRAGWQVVFLPEVAVVHLSGGTVKGFAAARSIERHRSRYTFFRKHRSPAARALLRAGVVIRLCFALVGDALLVALSLGRIGRASRRLSVAWSDLRWHLAGCPADAGLRQATRRPNLEAVEAEMAALSQSIPRATLGEPLSRRERLLKVALIIKDYAPQKGGGERYFDTLCREMLRRGHEVHAFVRSVESEPPAGLVLHLVGGGGGFGASSLRSFVDAVERELRPGRFDVTVALTQVWGADVYRAGGGLQRVWRRLQHPQRAVRLLADVLRPGRRLTGALEDHLFQRSLCQRVITNSALVRRQVLEEYRLLPEMVEVVYNGVDLARFAPLPAGEREAVRQGLGIGVDAPVVLFAANNFGRKGLATLLRALAAVRRVLPEVSLVVAGGGAERPFRQLAGRLGLDGAVHFVGRRADIHRLYPATDIFVLPTLYDPCANVCLEALACGTPVITTLANGAAEFLRPGETGYLLADASDHGGLARLLLHFFLRADRAHMSQQARSSMEAFTPEAHVDRLEAVLAEVARAAPPALSFERVGELTVNRGSAGLFRRHGLGRFEALAHIEPVVADREKRGRRLARFVLEGPAGEKMLFHLKAHRLRLRDLVRPLLSLARPATANATTEWWGMTELPRLGVATATPVAFAARRRWGLEWEGLTVSADLAGCTSLEEFLQRRIHPVGERSTGERAFLRGLAGELARVARSLHRRGVNHQDFYLGHFFIPAEQPLQGGPRLFLVDLQRLGRRRALPRRYLVKDLGQLLYSADQFPQLSRADKLRFLRFYLQERPLSPRAKRLARAVIAKAGQIARHSARVQARRA
jgi:hypothetical protein